MDLMRTLAFTLGIVAVSVAWASYVNMLIGWTWVTP